MRDVRLTSMSLTTNATIANVKLLVTGEGGVMQAKPLPTLEEPRPLENKTEETPKTE